MARKFTSPGHRGVPDHIYFGDDGFMFMIEFKKPGGRLSPAQIREIEALQRRGHLVFLVDNFEFGKGIIDGFAE